MSKVRHDGLISSLLGKLFVLQMEFTSLHAANLWLVMLLSASWYHRRCALFGIVMSTCSAWCVPGLATCDAACGALPLLCLPLSHVITIAPGFTGFAAAMLGPALTWIPLYLHCHRVPMARTVLASAMLVWLAFIHIVRYTAVLSIFGNWDPSGHVFMVGLQLAALWTIRYRSPLQVLAGSPVVGRSNHGSANLVPLPVTVARSVRGGADSSVPGKAAGGRASSRGKGNLQGKGTKVTQQVPSHVRPAALGLPPAFAILEAFLFLVSLTTACLHHHPTEVYAGAALSALGMGVCMVVQRDSAYGGHVRVRRWLTPVFCVWAIGGCIGIGLAVTGRLAKNEVDMRSVHNAAPGWLSWPLLFTLANLGYDAAVLLAAHFLLHA